MATTTYLDHISPETMFQNLPQWRQPTETIMGALNMRTRYFLDGAQKQKNAVEAADKFGLNLLHDTAKKQFTVMKTKADAELKNVSSTDLSIGSNITKGLKLYEPIVSDPTLLKDSELNNRLNSTYSAAKNDANKKGSTMGYNAEFVNYNRLMADRYKKGDISMADSYLNDKYIGSYQSNPSAEMQKYIKQKENQYLKTIVEEQSDPNNKFKKWTKTSVVIDADALKSDLLNNAPEAYRNQMEVQSRNRLLQAQGTMPPAEIEKNYSSQLKYMVDDKVLKLDKQMAELKAYAAANVSDPDLSGLYNRQLQAISDQRKNTVDRFAAINWKSLSDPNKLQEGFGLASDIDYEMHAYQMATSLGREVKRSTVSSADMAAVYQEQNQMKMLELQLKAQKAALDAAKKAGAAGPQSGYASGYETAPLTSGGDINKGKATIDFIQNGGAANAQLDVTKRSVQALNINVDGKNVMDYISENPEQTLGDLQDKFAKANDLKSYEMLKNIVAYTYAQDGKAKNGELMNPNADGFKNMKLSEMIPRLNYAFSDPTIFEGIAAQAGIAQQNPTLVYNMVTEMQDRKQDVDDNVSYYGGMFKEHLMSNNGGILDVEKLKKLPASDFTNLDKVFKENVNYRPIEASVGRALAPEEKARITKYLKSGNTQDLGVIPGVTRWKYYRPDLNMPPEIESEPQFLGMGDVKAFDQIEELKDRFKPIMSSLEEKINKDSKNIMFQHKNFSILDNDKGTKNTDWSKNVYAADFNQLVDWGTTMDGNNTNFDGDKDKEIRSIIKQNPSVVSNVEMIDTYKDIKLKLTINKLSPAAKLLETEGYTGTADATNKGEITITVPRERAEQLGFVKRAGNVATNEEIAKRGKVDFQLANDPTQVITIDKNNTISSNKDVYIPKISGNFVNVGTIKPVELNAELAKISPTFNAVNIGTLPKEVANEARRLSDAGIELKNLFSSIPPAELATYKAGNSIDISKIKDDKIISKIKTIYSKYGLTLPFSSESNNNLF